MERYGKILVEIQGRSPLLMNKLTPERLRGQERGRGGKITQVFDPEKEARESAYIDVIDGKETLYIPSEAVYQCILNASKIYKSGKHKMSELLAGSIRIEPEKIPLGTDKYEIDIRPVRIGSARVLRARAKVPKWKARFYIIYDKTLLKDLKLLRTVVEDAGVRIGLLDYRPQKGGPFGTFVVTKFEVIEDEADSQVPPLRGHPSNN
jgi:hypothetical protein